MQPELTVDIEIGADPAALDPEAARLMEEAEHEAKIAKLIAMRALVKRLSDKRDESIKAKRPIEEMMCDSLRLIRGESRYNDATKSQPVNSDSSNRPPRPKILRSRTRRWEARMGNMLSANPWDLEPDCDADYGDPNPAVEEDQKARAGRMKETIQKQFGWCRFDRSIRNMCHDAAHIGTGLIIGPRKAIRKKRKYLPPKPMPAPTSDWQQQGFVPAPAPQPSGGSQMVIEEYLVPEYTEGDPFCFFPDMTDAAEKAEYAHYVYLLGKMEVKNLAPGFDQMQINALLRKDPEHGELAINLRQRAQYLGTNDTNKDRYAVWRYTGVLGREDLELLGLCECEDRAEDELGAADPAPMAMADIWYCQDFILRASLAPVPDDFRIPYLVFAPFKLDGSMFGMSLAMMGEDSDRVAASAWLASLHSASVSSAPQIVIRSGKLQPADQQWSVRGPKTWKLTDDNTTMDEAIQVFHVPNFVQEGLQLFDRAIALMDEEMDTSQWASTEDAGEHDTASGLAMMMNARSILQIMVASTADDDVYEPGVSRAIWWNNDNNPDDSIKGNFIVKPLVQSERLVKDVQAQHAQVLASIGDNPRFQGMSDDYALYKYLASFSDAPVDDLILSREDYEAAQQNKPPDPMVLQTQLLQTQAETQKLKAQRETILAQTDQIKQQIALLELQGAQNPQVDNSGAMNELQLKQRDLDLKNRKIDADIAIAQQRTEAQHEATMAKMEQSRLDAQEFAYQKQQDRQAKLMTEGMKMEGAAQEMKLKRQTGSGI